MELQLELKADSSVKTDQVRLNTYQTTLIARSLYRYATSSEPEELQQVDSKLRKRVERLLTLSTADVADVYLLSLRKREIVFPFPQDSPESKTTIYETNLFTQELAAKTALSTLSLLANRVGDQQAVNTIINEACEGNTATETIHNLDTATIVMRLKENPLLKEKGAMTDAHVDNRNEAYLQIFRLAQKVLSDLEQSNIDKSNTNFLITDLTQLHNATHISGGNILELLLRPEEKTRFLETLLRLSSRNIDLNMQSLQELTSKSAKKIYGKWWHEAYGSYKPKVLSTTEEEKAMAVTLLEEYSRRIVSKDEKQISQANNLLLTAVYTFSFPQFKRLKERLEELVTYPWAQDKEAVNVLLPEIQQIAGVEKKD